MSDLQLLQSIFIYFRNAPRFFQFLEASTEGLIRVHAKATWPWSTCARRQGKKNIFFFGSRSNTPLTEDYSVIALVRGFNPSQWVMILAGTTTLGTQAAVEFVCSENSLKDLLGRLNASQTGQMKPFEAVLRVKVTRGVPVESSIVALRSGS